VSARTIYRRVERFRSLGMPEPLRGWSLSRISGLPRGHRQAIVQLKPSTTIPSLSWPPICEVRFERRPSSHTIQKILATEPPPAEIVRRFPHYAEMADPSERVAPSSGSTVRLERGQHRRLSGHPRAVGV